MLSCIKCKLRKRDAISPVNEPERYHPKTRCDRDSPLHPDNKRENQSLVAETHFGRDDDDCHPLTHTEMKTSKTSNTISVVKTTTSYSKVVKTESEEEDNTDPGLYDRVYKTTVIKQPKKKRFNLKSILDKRIRNSIKFTEQDLQLQQQCLFAHNRYRLKHGMKPLVLNKEMCQYATEWANNLANKNMMQHRKKNKYGENIALATGDVYSVEDSVKTWYEEIEHFDFENPEFSPITGHFSQVVWQETSQLGVGVAKKNNRTFLVCNYYPPGNTISQVKDNVMPPKGGTLTRSKRLSSQIPKNLNVTEAQEDVKPSTSKSMLRNLDPQPTKETENNKNQKFSKFELQCLEAHNKYRSFHGSKPMILNKDLCTLANDWAKHLAKIRSMYHRQQNEYGENIYQSINSDPSPEDAVKSWYEEIKNYNYDTPKFSAGTGHFTQVVWANSTELGVGRAKVDNMTFIVCNYNPPGNILNFYKTQVPPVGGFTDKVCENGRKDSANGRKLSKSVKEDLDSSIKLKEATGCQLPSEPKKGSNFILTSWSKFTKGSKKVH